jgi:hypothetical protein
MDASPLGTAVGLGVVDVATLWAGRGAAGATGAFEGESEGDGAAATGVVEVVGAGGIGSAEGSGEAEAEPSLGDGSGSRCVEAIPDWLGNVTAATDSIIATTNADPVRVLTSCRVTVVQSGQGRSASITADHSLVRAFGTREKIKEDTAHVVDLFSSIVAQAIPRRCDRDRLLPCGERLVAVSSRRSRVDNEVLTGHRN